MFEVLFQYGPFTFRTINLFVTLGFLSTLLVALRYIESKKMNSYFLANHFIFLLFAPLFAGRLFHVIENVSYYQNNIFHILFLWDLQLSSFGAFYGLFTGLYFLTRHAGENFWIWLDTFTVSGMTGLIFIHIGHFFNGTHYGKPTDLPWGIAFDTLNIPFLNPIHPTQLYSSLLAFFVFLFAMKYNRRIHLSGMVGSLVIILYAIGAFAIDFLHVTPSSYEKISFLVIIAVAFIFFIHCSHQTHYDKLKKDSKN
jgi:phosphatidylglycerol---prolipoprotein diacylglyceryl transferase